MRLTSVKLVIGLSNTLALMSIVFFFGLSFLYPGQGPFHLIYASGILAFIGALFVIIHFLERKNDSFQYALIHIHRYLSFSLRYFLTLLSIIALLTSFVIFIVTSKKEYFVNCGCFIAFIMIILLIELFIRILLPLAGLDQNV